MPESAPFLARLLIAVAHVSVIAALAEHNLKTAWVGFVDIEIRLFGYVLVFLATGAAFLVIRLKPQRKTYVKSGPLESILGGLLFICLAQFIAFGGRERPLFGVDMITVLATWAAIGAACLIGLLFLPKAQNNLHEGSE